eukprot:2051958-Pyramimonas_sp.AAC.1
MAEDPTPQASTEDEAADDLEGRPSAVDVAAAAAAVAEADPMADLFGDFSSSDDPDAAPPSAAAPKGKAKAKAKGKATAKSQGEAKARAKGQAAPGPPHRGLLGRGVRRAEKCRARGAASGRRPVERPAGGGAAVEDSGVEFGPTAREEAAAGEAAASPDGDGSGDDAMADLASAWAEAAAELQLPRRGGQGGWRGGRKRRVAPVGDEAEGLEDAEEPAAPHPDDAIPFEVVALLDAADADVPEPRRDAVARARASIGPRRLMR